MTDPNLVDVMTTVTDVKILVLVIFICIGLVVLIFVTALPLLTRKAAAEMAKEKNGQAAECALVTGLRNTIRWQAEQLAAAEAKNEKQQEYARCKPGCNAEHSDKHDCTCGYRKEFGL